MSAKSPLSAIDSELDRFMALSPLVLELLRDKKLFLTGGTGFFGVWLLTALHRINVCHGLHLTATILSRRPEHFMAAHPELAKCGTFSFVQGDVRDFDFPPGSFDYVLIAAAEANVALERDAPVTMHDTIVQGTRRVLDFSRQCQAERVLCVSSGAVYGRQPGGMLRVPETYAGSPDHLAPGNAYAIGKRVAEYLCATYARQYGLAIPIARCFAFLGPFLPLDKQFAAGNFIADALKGGPIQVQGDGSPYRSYMYPTDLVEWLLTLLVRGVSGQAYNVGSDEAVSIGELATLVAALAGRLAVHIAQAPDQTREPSRYVPDIEKARREFDLSLRVDLRHAISRTLDFHRSANVEEVACR